MLAFRVFATDGTTDITRVVNASVKRRVAAMNELDYRNLQHGQAVELVCVDPSSFARLRPFYHPGESVVFKTQSEFDELIGDLLSRNAPDYKSELRHIEEHISVATRELFINTHLHAMRDAGGVKYRRGTRGVIVAQHFVRRDQIEKFSTGVVPLKTYLEALDKLELRPNIKLIEISVFDSGPGLAARMHGASLSQDLSIEDEYLLVQQCFLKNVTSMTDQGYGLGLTRVLRAMKAQGGFLWLRTGRLSVFRSFLPGAFAADAPLQDLDFQLEDVDQPAAPITPKPQVAGTVVSLLVPVGIGRQ